MTSRSLFLSWSCILSCFFFASLMWSTPCQAISERERMQQYHKRNYTWPIENYVPNTPGWRKIMEERFAQVEELSNYFNRFDAYMHMATAAVVSPNFTEYGFGLGRAPEGLTRDLQQGVRESYEGGHARREQRIKVIDGPLPFFVDRPDLTERALHELHGHAEAWAQLELTPFIAYGFRLYQNNSVLHMHADKPQTHIISIILHIDSSEDAEPWPIFIEDFHGNTHEVILTPGDILFYESSKCMHGRPRKFQGSWYTSVFIHYYPTQGWQDVDRMWEAQYAIPEHWVEDPPAVKKHVPLEMAGTGFTEPSCPDEWCRTQDAIKWGGPGEEGYWIAPNMERHPLIPRGQQRYEEL